MVDGTVTRAGFVALAGRPNVGKSTLVNGMVGGKIAIVSDKPQTTRRAIRGVATAGDTQLVLVDLPGVQRPRDMLTERMQRRVVAELSESDVALLVINGQEGVGPGDRFIAGAITQADVPVAIAVNKVDRMEAARLLEVIAAVAALGIGDDIFPVSARTGEGVDRAARPPRRADAREPVPLRPGRDAATSPRTCCWPSSCASRSCGAPSRRSRTPSRWSSTTSRSASGLTLIRALVWVETESQKGILIGAGGKMVKAVGTAARKELERELGTRVHLDLSVRVRRGWRGDDALLDRLGIE